VTPPGSPWFTNHLTDCAISPQIVMSVPIEPASRHSGPVTVLTLIVNLVLAGAAVVTVIFAWQASREGRKAVEAAQATVLAVRAAHDSDERDRKIRQLREIGLQIDTIRTLAAEWQDAIMAGPGSEDGETPLIRGREVLAQALAVRGAAGQNRDPGRHDRVISDPQRH
jgi:hypothetical protein